MRQMFRYVPADESRATLVALGVGVALTAVKFAAYFLTGSAAVFSDAVEGTVNIAAAVVLAFPTTNDTECECVTFPA